MQSVELAQSSGRSASQRPATTFQPLADAVWAAALRQDVALIEGKATPNYQDSQVDVSDMTFVQVANRQI